jgi:hypothetical protein
VENDSGHRGKDYSGKPIFWRAREDGNCCRRCGPSTYQFAPVHVIAKCGGKQADPISALLEDLERGDSGPLWVGLGFLSLS